MMSLDMSAFVTICIEYLGHPPRRSRVQLSEGVRISHVLLPELLHGPPQLPRDVVVVFLVGILILVFAVVDVVVGNQTGRQTEFRDDQLLFRAVTVLSGFKKLIFRDKTILYQQDPMSKEKAH